MRSRPKLDVFLSPKTPRPGDELSVRARLTSRSETPIRGLSFDLVGTERRYSHTSTVGSVSSSQYESIEIIRLRCVTPAEQLKVGNSSYEARFPLPEGAPPTFSSSISTVRYGLTVEVDIPWWPNRRSEYEVKVLPPPWRAEPRGPRVYATHRDGPQAGQLYIEATLDPLSASLGGKLRGAISLANVSSRARAVKLSLVASDEARFESAKPAVDIRRYDYVLAERPPASGVSLPFSIRIPENETPSFTSRLVRLSWSILVQVQVAWSDDVTLRIPIVIAPEAAAFGATAELERLPPVGRERRAQVWAHVAAKHGMTNDPSSELMTTQIGDVGLRVHLEDRDKQGLVSVATLSWPDLGIDLSLRERKWSDVLTRGVVPDLPDELEKRLAVTCREPEQGRAFLAGELVAAISALSDVAMDDEGALLATPGGGHRLEHLDRFVLAARTLAEAAHTAARRIPAPRAAASWEERWAEFAREHGGRLERGSLSVVGFSWGGVRFDLRSAWSDAGALAGQGLEHTLEEQADVDSEIAQVELAKAQRELSGLTLEASKLTLACPTPVADPASLEPQLVRLERLVKALRGERSFGAYR